LNNLGILLAGIVLFSIVVSSKRRRDQRLNRIRANWGRPADHPRQFSALAESHISRISVSAGTRSLDDRTWADLSLDNVFAAIDRTTSTLGQQALYHRLRTAPVGENLEAFEVLTERLRDDVLARERAQIALDRLQDPQGYNVWWLGQPDAVEGRRWFAIFPVLTAAALVSIALLLVSPAFVIVMLLVNMPARFLTDRRIGAIASSIRQCAPLIGTAAALKFIAADDVQAITQPLRDDVSKLARLKWISSWANGNPFMLSFDSTPVLIMVNDFISVVYEYLNLLLLLDATGAYFGLRDLNANRASLLRITAAVGDVDAAISVASYREGSDSWTRPVFRRDGPLTLTDLRHPLLADAVPNSITLQPGGGVLVTGSNMSGKSTFLRTVGVNAILAQTVNTCLAREYAGPVLEVRSCIGRSDDLIAGKSYYLVEVEALLVLVRLSESADPHLFLLDELFRGTNAVERVAAAYGVLQELVTADHGRKPHVVIAATHDGELVNLSRECYDAYHFGDSIGPDGLVFDHRLKVGPATTRTAIALLRQSGAPETLLERATATAALLDGQRNA
jgi:hypothetical protein